MIPFDFIYLRPDTLAQAIALHGELSRTGKSPVYYAGGSEIITMSRVCAIRPGAVIDIKGLPDLQTLAQNEGGLTLGAGLTLASIAESKRFALMKLACGRIADHTNQCRITLGGNLCGTIRYRETSLPLLLCDAAVTLAGADGARTLPFEQAFDGRVLRAPDEVLTQVHVPAWALGARHAHIKKTAQEKIDYPLVNLTAIWKGDALRVAFSGLCENPVRLRGVEDAINDRAAPPAARTRRAMELLAPHAHGDCEGSREYRLFVAAHTLNKLLEDWEHGLL